MSYPAPIPLDCPAFVSWFFETFGLVVAPDDLTRSVWVHIIAGDYGRAVGLMVTIHGSPPKGYLLVDWSWGKPVGRMWRNYGLQYTGGYRGGSKSELHLTSEFKAHGRAAGRSKEAFQWARQLEALAAAEPPTSPF